MSKKNYKLLDPLIDRILAICREKNLKLNPSKFKIGPEVEFGGTVIKYSQTNNRVQITPSEQKIEELMGKEAPKTKKTTSKHPWFIEPAQYIVAADLVPYTIDEEIIRG